jgi:hypothetical protein
VSCFEYALSAVKNGAIALLDPSHDRHVQSGVIFFAKEHALEDVPQAPVKQTVVSDSY